MTVPSPPSGTTTHSPATQSPATQNMNRAKDFVADSCHAMEDCVQRHPAATVLTCFGSRTFGIGCSSGMPWENRYNNRNRIPRGHVEGCKTRFPACRSRSRNTCTDDPKRRDVCLKTNLKRMNCNARCPASVARWTTTGKAWWTTPRTFRLETLHPRLPMGRVGCGRRRRFYGGAATPEGDEPRRRNPGSVGQGESAPSSPCPGPASPHATRRAQGGADVDHRYHATKRDRLGRPADWQLVGRRRNRSRSRRPMKNRISGIARAGTARHQPREVDRGRRPGKTLKRTWPSGLHGLLKSHLAQHPKLTLGVGLAMGVCIGWLIKRTGQRRFTGRQTGAHQAPTAVPAGGSPEAGRTGP